MTKTKANGELKIERNVPVPEKYAKNGYFSILRQLKLNESVMLPIPCHKASVNASHVLGKGNYVARTVEGGARVWRIK